VGYLLLRIQLKPGTLLTVDVKTDGQWVSPRMLNQYPGIGVETWETISVPVHGQLEILSISIAEINDLETTPEYRMDLDWIKAFIQNTPIAEK
jgi:hypothetical protein